MSLIPLNTAKDEAAYRCTPDGDEGYVLVSYLCSVQLVSPPAPEGWDKGLGNTTQPASSSTGKQEQG